MIDMLRGLVIAIMVLDHVRDYFHVDAFSFDPTNLSRTTAILFATRWITHLCAPTFVFLAGVSIFLQRANGKTGMALSRFLLTRGLWLVILELTVLVFGFNFVWPFAFLQVIWAIGVGMILLSAAVWLPRSVVLALGAAIVAGHGLFGAVNPGALGAWGPLWTLMMKPGAAPFLPGVLLYPAIPWFGIMCLGYGLGHVFLQPSADRQRTLALLGCGALLLFVVLRAINGYGDPAPWSVQKDALFTALSFINVSKYPPSLFYVLITLGVSLLLLLGLQRLRGMAASVLLVFGRTSLFTYVVHIYVVHTLAMLIGMARGVPASAFVNFLSDPSRLIAAHWGLSLPAVYGLWLSILVMLYPVSRWFADVKRRQRDWWLSYL
jgi:uncharacterized membrane protein